MSVGRILQGVSCQGKENEEIENELEIDLNDIKTKIVGLRSQLLFALSSV